MKFPKQEGKNNRTIVMKEESSNDIIKYSFEIYKKYYLRSVLLEIFGKNEPLNNNEIKGWLFAEIRKENEIFRTTTMSEVMREFEYISKVGYLVLIDNEDKITISECGIKALKECVLQDLSNTAFFGYKSLFVSNNSLEVSRTALSYSKTACWITGFALLFSAASFVVALCK
jgi:hypothetical protein